MSRVRKSLLFSTTNKYINNSINLLTVIIIARILTPDELGIYAIAASIMLIANELKSFGVGNYLIRSKYITHEIISRSIGLTIIISWSIAILLILFSGNIQSFYEKDDIQFLIIILSLNFFFTPYIGVARALLAREFRFELFLFIDTTKGLIQLFLAIALILNNYSYLSLAIASTVSTVIEFIFIIFVKNENFIWKPSFTKLNDITKFGLYVTLSNLFNKLSINLPDLIIGKIGTASQVAYMSRGIGFLDFISKTIIQGVNPVVMPYLADKKRNNENIEESYHRANLLLGSIILPVLSVAGLASYPAIMVFFGDQWQESASLVSILTLWAIFKGMTILSPSIMITLGHEKSLFIKELIIVLLTSVSIYFTYHWGLDKIAWSLVIISSLNFVYSLFLLKIKLDFSLISVFKSILPNIFICIICSFATILIDFVIDFKSENPFKSIFILAPTILIMWACSIILIKHPVLDEVKYIIRKTGIKF